MKKVSIIIPCYNEEESLPQLWDKLKELEAALKLKYAHSFIFVDDGSKDKTYEILSRRVSELTSAIVIKHEVNKNLGAALKTGIANLSPGGDYVTFLDSDCTYEPEIVMSLLKEMESGYDLSTASPYHPQGQVEGVPEWRLFLSKGLSFLYRVVLGTNLYTYTAMVRIVRQDKIHPIIGKRNDFSFVAEMLIKAVRLHYKISEVPTVLRVRKFGVSKINIIKTIKAHLEMLRKLMAGNEV